MVCVCHLTLFLSVGMRGVACEVNCFCPRLDCSLWLGPRKSLSCAPRRVYFPRLCACSPFFFFNLLLYCCVVGSFGGVLFSLCLPGVHLNAIAIFIPPNTSLLVTNEAHDTFNVLEVFLDVCRHCAWRTTLPLPPWSHLQACIRAVIMKLCIELYIPDRTVLLDIRGRF